MKVAAIIPAAGESRRMGGKIRKPFLLLHRVPILVVTLRNLMECPQIESFFVCIRPQDRELCHREILSYLPSEKRVEWVEGGERRQDSVHNALLRVDADADLIMIHDGVRPFVSSRMLKIAIEETLRWGATAFGLPVKETIKTVDEEGWAVRTIERDGLWNIQTPQTFERPILQSAYREAYELGLEATDDASLVERTGRRVKVLLGSPENIKVTTPEDLLLAEGIISAKGYGMLKVGLGYDIHALVKGRPLVLGGVKVNHDQGLSGDSDADVLIHAIIDAILGAAGEGDIGEFFGVGTPELQGASSLHLLEELWGAMERKGMTINNIDATVIAQAPHLSPYIGEMKKNIGRALSMDLANINIKATTAKGLGVIGEGKGISAQAIVSACLEAPLNPVS